MKNLSVLLLSIVLLSACRDDKKKEPETVTKPAPTVNMTPGVVHKTVGLKAKPEHTYALYLPKSFDTSKRYPVLYCFDPKGFGALPVMKYKVLADAYDFILVGSNVSRNGMDPKETDLIAQQLVHEIQNTYPVEDSIRVFGFSGGAKVAFHYADNNPLVGQVIYVGAVSNFKRTHGISLLGIAGIRDMNYADLVGFEVSLGKAPFRHHLIQTTGQHDYPEEKDMRDAFIWMKTGHVEGYDVKKVTVSPEEIMKEQLLKRKFYQSFGKKDLAWWKTEIQALHQFKKEDVLYERVLGFIGLTCYSFADHAIKSGDFQSADYIVEIYQMATPDNKDAADFRKAVDEAIKRAKP